MRKHGFIAILSLYFSIVVFFQACKKEAAITKLDTPCITYKNKPIFNVTTTAALNAKDYNGTVCGIIPLGKNYKWIYRDSLFDNMGQFVQTKMDTLFVEKTVFSTADSSILWKLRSTSGRAKGINDYFVYSTDSILYYTDRAYVGPGVPVPPIYATEWLKIYRQDYISSSAFLSDMGYLQIIKKLSSSIVVPYGSINGCIETTKMLYGREIITLKPGLGIVKYTSYEDPFNELPSNKRQVSELVAFVTP
jgi:hypothetical protein